MRNLITVYLIICAQFLQAQVLCDSISNNVQLRQNVFIDSLYTDKPQYCQGDTVEFYFEWENPDELGVKWIVNSPMRYLDGGMAEDTFYRGILFGADTFNISVTPIHPCGVENERIIPGSTTFPIQISRNACSGHCLQIGDSCYYQSTTTPISTGLANSFGCDSLVILTLNFFDILPSPLVKCEPTQDGIFVEWEPTLGVDSYVVFVDRDSFTTITDNFILLENINIDSTVNVKIQPFGACTYLPAEINCLNGISTTVPNFSNNEIKVFPNPTNGNISIKTELKIESVEVFDLSGRFLQKEKTTSFELKSNLKGIFILKIKTNKGVAVKRVVQN